MAFAYLRLIQMSKEIKDKDIVKKIAEYRDAIYKQGNSRAKEFGQKGPLDTLNENHTKVLNTVGEQYLSNFPNCDVAKMLLTGDSVNAERNRMLAEGDFSFAHDDSAMTIFNGGLGKLSMTSTWVLSNLIRFSSVAGTILSHGKNPTRILDLGCSSGTFLTFWYRNYQAPGKLALDYTGIEVVAKSYNDARERHPKHKFINADLVKTRVSDHIKEKLDIVLALEVLEHVGQEAVDRVLEDAHELLDDDGLIIVSSPNPKKHLGQQFMWIDNHVYEFSLDEMEELLTRHGFEVTEVFGWLCDAALMKRTIKGSEDMKIFESLKHISTAFAYAVLSHMHPDTASHYTIVAKKVKKPE